MQQVPLLQIIDLNKHFPVARGIWGTLTRKPRETVRAVDGVTLTLERGKIVALVGESGSGKTTVGMNALGLQLPTSGKVLLDGFDMTQWARGGGKSLDAIGGELESIGRRKRVLALRRRAQMIFQDPYEALNPRQKVFDIVAEPLEIHHMARSESDKRDRVRAALDACGLAPADHFWGRYPSELSGGQRQRVVIAGALVLEPELIVADEPVSMLDVSIRAEILTVLGRLRDDHNIGILYITHDLATAAYFTDQVMVMYLGRIVESGPTREVLGSPGHPYTQALLSVIPAPNPRSRRKRIILQGETPNPIHVPAGCRFHPRCPQAYDECSVTSPELLPVGQDHSVACLRAAARTR